MKQTEIDLLIINILSKEANDLEKKEFNDWYKKSGDNQLYFKKFAIVWEKSAELYNHVEFDKKAAIEVIQKKIRRQNLSQSRKLKHLYARVSIAASILLIAGLSFLIYFYTGSENLIDYPAANIVTKIVLPDSTLIWINRNSKLTSPSAFNKNERTVYLEGEAFFEVTKDKTKPFKVISGKTVTKVLGTSFNINHNKPTGDVKVTVSAGKVLFYKKFGIKRDNILLPGEVGYYNGIENSISLSTNQDQNYVSWKTGELVFKDTHISEVCKVLSKHFGKSITTDITDPEIIFTARFKDEKLDKVLEILKITLNIQIKISNNNYLIYK